MDSFGDVATTVVPGMTTLRQAGEAVPVYPPSKTDTSHPNIALVYAGLAREESGRSSGAAEHWATHEC